MTVRAQDEENSHVCYVRGMELAEVLDDVDRSLSLARLSDSKLAERTVFKRDVVLQGIQRGLEEAVRKIVQQKCLDVEVRDGAHKAFVDMALSAKQRDFHGMEERLYELREMIALSRYETP